MKLALRDTPQDVPELTAGLEGLVKRIVETEEEVGALEKKLLATGGLKKGEGEELRDGWTSVGEGPKIKFAGTMVDSELVRGAGMEDLVEEELAALALGEGEEDGVTIGNGVAPGREEKE
jgi:hypothetical protein